MRQYRRERNIADPPQMSNNEAIQKIEKHCRSPTNENGQIKINLVTVPPTLQNSAAVRSVGAKIFHRKFDLGIPQRQIIKHMAHCQAITSTITL